jgi:very-short-patch-repair endonuclease
VGRVRGNAEGHTKRQQLPASTVARSRELRRTAGEPERRLWRALREALPDAKFRRQVPLGRYHADFCSHAAKLVVEVDGNEHAARSAHDAERTRLLQTEGYRVVRFSNAEVMENIEGVIAAITSTIADKQKGRP